MQPPTPTATIPNHHAHHPGFRGVGGLLAGLTMIAGRGAAAQLAIGLTGVTSADHVVDVGCGPGSAARAAARLGAAVTAVDPAGVMLALARRLTRGRRPVTWMEGTAEALPLADASATVVWSLSTVHHWRDVDQGLGEARRVLAPGGRLLAVERRVRPGATGLAGHGWTDAQAEGFADRCRAVGFDDVRVETHTPRRRRLLVVTGRRR